MIRTERGLRKKFRQGKKHHCCFYIWKKRVLSCSRI